MQSRMVNWCGFESPVRVCRICVDMISMMEECLLDDVSNLVLSVDAQRL